MPLWWDGDQSPGQYAWWGGAVLIHVGRGLGNLLAGPMVKKTLDVVKATFTIVYAASADMFSFLQIHVRMRPPAQRPWGRRPLSME